jgi:hypothetical protein
MLDFRVVIAACVAGIVILFGGIGLVASFKIAHEPAVRPANRLTDRPHPEPNASRPVVIETPAVKPAPVAIAAPEPTPVSPVEARAPAPPAAIETTGTIAPRSAPIRLAPEIRAPAFPAALAPAATEPVENPAAVAGLPVNTKSAAKKGPRRPRPAAPAPGPSNPFSAIFGGFNNQ